LIQIIDSLAFFRFFGIYSGERESIEVIFLHRKTYRARYYVSAT
jgi:hypothetical protein